MCGIAGFIAPELEDPEAVIGCQLNLLHHRGPDSFGAHRGRGAIIGQTRLAVIDLHTGDPPIANEDRSVGAALNGEIYNFQELREELRARGHVFGTRVDTEVLAHLAEELDPLDLAAALEGMFAFAVWHEPKGRLILARDRFGKKPLYYWSSAGRLVFASEIKALHAHPSVPKDLNDRALSAYLSFGYVPTPETFYKGILSVPPGSVLVKDPGVDPVVTPFWKPPASRAETLPPLNLSFREAAIQTRSLLRASVERRLVSDVPLGAFLSGGIDSSTVVGIMARDLGRKVQTFTIGFDDREGFDERPYARSVADAFSTDHTEFVVKPDAIDLIERLVWHYDQPFGDSSAIPTYLLSQLTREHVTVALSGDGGDEAFAGYERFAAAVALERYLKMPRGARAIARRAVFLARPRGPRSRVRSVQRFVRRADMGLPDAFMSWISFMDENWRQALLPGASPWAADEYHQLWKTSEGWPLLHRLLDLNIRSYLVDDLLPKMDRTSMAHALEVRSPFLDHRLIDLSARLTQSFHLRGFTLKRLLKESVKDLLPPDLLHRRKAGFGIPLDRWLRTDLASYTRSMLCSRSSRLRTHLQPSAIDELVNEHMAGDVNHGHALWALLTLEVWLKAEGW